MLQNRGIKVRILATQLLRSFQAKINDALNSLDDTLRCRCHKHKFKISDLRQMGHEVEK